MLLRCCCYDGVVRVQSWDVTFSSKRIPTSVSFCFIFLLQRVIAPLDIHIMQAFAIGEDERSLTPEAKRVMELMGKVN